MAEFECRLKKYRQLKDLTQEQLAEQVGVRRETIMRLEKAQYNPSLKLAVDISRAVEAPIEEIFIFPYQQPLSSHTSQIGYSQSALLLAHNLIKEVPRF